VKFFYDNPGSRVSRIEIISYLNPDTKTPVVLKYNNNNNIEKIICKKTVTPASPLYNDINYLSAYNPATESSLTNYIDSISYNPNNYVKEIYQGSFYGTPNFVYDYKLALSYFPGDSLVSEVKYIALASNIALEVMTLSNYDVQNINPLYLTDKHIYLLRKSVLAYPVMPVVPIQTHYAYNCDHVFGISKYFPKHIYSSEYNAFVGYLSSDFDFRNTVDAQNRITFVYPSSSSGVIDKSRFSWFTSFLWSRYDRV